jgi:L-threonylcarbamoyladenylate synthase
VDKHLQKACSAIQADGLITYPTEGVFGIGCNPLSEPALSRLIRLKQRHPNKGFILIASKLDMLRPYMRPLPKAIAQKVFATWPGPVTWIVPAANNLSPLLNGNRDTIAVRVSAHPFVQAICNTLGHALVSSSANISGHPPISSVKCLEQTLGKDIDYIVPLSPGKLLKPTPIFDALTGLQLR